MFIKKDIYLNDKRYISKSVKIYMFIYKDIYLYIDMYICNKPNSRKDETLWQFDGKISLVYQSSNAPRNY